MRLFAAGLRPDPDCHCTEQAPKCLVKNCPLVNSCPARQSLRGLDEARDAMRTKRKHFAVGEAQFGIGSVISDYARTVLKKKLPDALIDKRFVIGPFSCYG